MNAVDNVKLLKHIQKTRQLDIVNMVDITGIPKPTMYRLLNNRSGFTQKVCTKLNRAFETTGFVPSKLTEDGTEIAYTPNYVPKNRSLNYANVGDTVMYLGNRGLYTVKQVKFIKKLQVWTYSLEGANTLTNIPEEHIKLINTKKELVKQEEQDFLDAIAVEELQKPLTMKIEPIQPKDVEIPSDPTACKELLTHIINMLIDKL